MNRLLAKCTPLLFTALAAVSAVAQQLPTHSQSGDKVWIWSKQCNGQRKLSVIVRSDTKVLFSGVLPICRGSREAENGRVEFHFAGGRTFQGKYPTRSTDLVEGDMWQAGGESNAIILGVSFAASKHELLNTLYIARPEKKASSELDKGLSIATDPILVR
jgi:hypothetical protein